MVCYMSANAQDENNRNIPATLSVRPAKTYSEINIDDSIKLNPARLYLPALNSYTASPMIEM